jgi:hypothetical protein
MGSFRSAFLVKSTQEGKADMFVINEHIALDRSTQKAEDCAISREANVYSAFHRDSREKDYPLPRTRSMLGGGLHGLATFGVCPG